MERQGRAKFRKALNMQLNSFTTKVCRNFYARSSVKRKDYLSSSQLYRLDLAYCRCPINLKFLDVTVRNNLLG